MRIDDLQPQEGSQHRKRRIGRGIAGGQGASGGLGTCVLINYHLD